MRHLKIYYLFILLNIFSISCQNEEAKIYIAKIEQQRSEKNREYSDSLKSPLNPIHLKIFNGLDYFDIDPDFCVEGTFEQTPEEKPFVMATSTDRAPTYRKYGNFHFTLKNKEFTLGAFQDIDYIDDTAYNQYLFLPFQDLTSAKESYGGGRYIDILIPKTKKITVDFNLAYNPYCAYDDRWSCVIPPPENFLNIKILAGEKKFHLATH
ncbi:MAG: hypothetical protein DRI74_09205 [Bacteroidetes bacterium]|nr:MAG: hypothetical protein DRI74_09205 [Bacteroidota bacterium]